MDEQYYSNMLNNYDMQIADLEATINNIQKEIDEVVSAQANAKNLRNDFDSFVLRKKQKKDSSSGNNLIKSFASFVSKATKLLTGTEYTNANDRIDEINRMLTNKLNRLNEDLEYCQSQLYRASQNREDTYREYVEYMNSSEMEGV